MSKKTNKNISYKQPKSTHIKPEDKSKTYKDIPKWAPLTVILFTALIYIRTLANGFATWDDDSYILQNPFIMDFSVNGIKSIFTSFQSSGNYHPLTTLIDLLIYTIFKINPLPYHLLNVLLHLTNTWLVYKIVQKISNKNVTALVVSLLFAIHPMHVESVVWASELKDVLYSLFYLLSLLLYLNYLKLNYKPKYYFGAIVFFIISLLSKSAAITLPVLLVVIDIYKGRKINAKSLLEKVPFFILSIFFGILALLSQKSVIDDFFYSYSFIEKIFLFTYTVSFYIIKFVAPLNLSAMHYYPDMHSGILPWQYFASLPFLLLIIFLVLKLTPHANRQTGFRKEIIFGVLFFIITISITLQIINVGFALTAERYTYIPYIGLFYIIGQWISGIVFRQFDKPGKKEKPVSNFIKNTVVAIFLIFIIMFSYQTWARIGIWKDGEILFTDVIKKNPNMYHCYWIRGNIRYGKADYLGALEDYNSALKYNPKHFCRRNRGYVYNKLKDYKSTIEDMNIALSLDSTIAETYNLRGLAYYGLNNLKSAIHDYNNAIRLDPKYAEAYNNRGAAYYGTGNYKLAIFDYDKAIQLSPEYAEAYNNRGAAYSASGNLKAAILDLDKTIQLSPKYSAAYENRSMFKAQSGDINGAIEDINTAISLDPDNAKTYNNRGYIKTLKKDYKGAIEDFNYSIKLKPDDGKVYFDRGITRLNLNETAGACDDWEKASELGYENAIQAMHQYCK